MNDENIKKLPLFKILDEAFNYLAGNLKAAGIFALVNYVLCCLCIYSWKTIWFWFVVGALYILWSVFFRFYFGRQPYFLWRPLLYSMVPSTKILVLSTVLVTLLLALPVVPLFLGVDASYNQFLQKYMQDSDVINALTNLAVVLLSPWIIYRPFLAWISAVTGRSGSLKNAWVRTRGNYWEFLLLGVIMNLTTSGLYYGLAHLGIGYGLSLVVISPLIVYYNVVLAKIYEFFFLEID